MIRRTSQAEPDRPHVTENMMSSLTRELMLLLHDDGVDQNELKALVDSAFQDGVAYTIKTVRPNRPAEEG